MPIVFRGPNGAAAGVAAQHSQDFSSWYAHVPGLKVRERGREGGRERGRITILSFLTRLSHHVQLRTAEDC